MEDITESLETHRHRRDELKGWWAQNNEQLSPEQHDELFDWCTEDKFGYLPILIRLTLDTADTPHELAENLERLAPLIDHDLAWGDFYNVLEEKLSGQPSFAQELYEELSSRTDSWPKHYIGFALAELPDAEAIEEILYLLRSRDSEKVDAAVRGLVIRFGDEEIPQEIIDELSQLSDDTDFHPDVLKASSALFKSDPELWEVSLDIARTNPSTIQGFINLFGREIEQDHLPEYLNIIERGLEEGTTEDIHIEHLYLDFADETEQIADFTVTLSEHQLTTAKQLTDQTTDRQEEGDILPALLDRFDEFQSAYHGTEVVFSAGEKNPQRLASMIIERYDEYPRISMLQLLKKAVGELFTSTTYERETAIEIADFLETVEDSSFIRPLDRELIEEDPDNGEARNKDVYHHLYEVISDHLDNRDYDLSTLDLLTEYPNLNAHFRDHLERKLEQQTYHPMLTFLQREAHNYLEFLEENWDRIPEPKQRQLLGEAFQSTLSEIGLLLWIDDRGLDYQVDVNLHAHDTGEELDKDVDLVVDGNYIEIRAPKTWRNLEVANHMIGIPNTAYNKIADKFKSDYAGVAELTQEPVFIALDITTSEISPEEVISSLYGAMKIRLTYDTETGQAVDEQPIRDPEDSLKGWPLLDDNLNGVIWYTARIHENPDGTPRLQVEGNVVPNPHHEDEGNIDYCVELKDELFEDQ